MIVVTAPTGTIGSQVLAHLVDRDLPVRVIVRDPSRLPEPVRSRIEIVEGSHRDAEVVVRAFDGAHTVFWLSPGDPAEPSAEAAYVDFIRPACEALKGGTVERVVAVSALGRGWPRDAGHVTATLRADDMVAETGVALRALACASLMENVLRQLQPIRREGIYRWPSPADQELPHVASRDVAAVAARLLSDASWDGVDEIPLTGPEAISFDEIAATMGEVLQRPVRFEAIRMDAMRDMMTSMGGSPGMAEAMVTMLTAKNAGLDGMVPLSPVAETPTTFRQWSEEVLRSAVERERAAPVVER